MKTVKPPTGRGHQLSGDHTLDSVMGYQHPGVVRKLQKNLNINEKQAKAIFDDTKRFLFISGTCPGNWGPTLTIDAGWHEFVLFTKDYAAFCNKFFGKFLHHTPNDPAEPKDYERPRRTLIAAIQLFGKETLSENWIYRDKDGKPTLGPKMALPEIAATALDECSDGGNACGCNGCGGDSGAS